MKSNKKSSKGLKGVFSAALIPVAFIISVLVYKFVLGDGANFIGGNNANLPLPGNYYGVVILKGVLLCLLIITCY